MKRKTIVAKNSKSIKKMESYKWTKIIWECMRRNREIQKSAGSDFVFLSFDDFIENKQRENPGLIGEILIHEFLQDVQSVKYHCDKSRLQIEVDLNEIYSVDSLKKLVSKIIDQFYSVGIKLKDITPKKRPNMTDFETILKVGDMKREGKKNQEIARAIHPRKYAKNPESAIRLVAYYNKRYKDLVDNNGFTKCGYP
jgi:hypothetical protein